MASLTAYMKAAHFLLCFAIVVIVAYAYAMQSIQLNSKSQHLYAVQQKLSETTDKMCIITLNKLTLIAHALLDFGHAPFMAWKIEEVPRKYSCQDPNCCQSRTKGKPNAQFAQFCPAHRLFKLLLSILFILLYSVFNEAYKKHWNENKSKSHLNGTKFSLLLNFNDDKKLLCTRVCFTKRNLNLGTHPVSKPITSHWIFDRGKFFFSPANRPKYVTVYPGFRQEIPRLSSYCNLSPQLLPNCISVVRLSSAGFNYTGYKGLLSCQGCGNTMDISVFKTDGDTMADPTSGAFHAGNCSFVSIHAAGDLSAEDKVKQAEGGEGMSSESFEDENNLKHVTISKSPFDPQSSADSSYGDSAESSLSFKAETFTYNNAQDSTEFKGPEEIQGSEIARQELTQSALNLENICTRTDDTISFVSSNVEQYQSRSTPVPTVLKAPAAKAAKQTTQPQSGKTSYSETTHTRSTAASQEAASTSSTKQFNLPSSYSDLSDAHAGDKTLIDANIFEAEVEDSLPKPTFVHKDIRAECKKNPGHFAYFEAMKLKKEQLPAEIRCDEAVKFFQGVAALTVRIVVSEISDKRPSSGAAAAPPKLRVGTGSVLDLPCKEQPPKQSTSSVAWTGVKKCLTVIRREKPGVIYVETDRHLVFDNKEAAHTTVEFFYNPYDLSTVKKVKGVFVIHSKTPGDYKSYLVCKTKDLKFVESLNIMKAEMRSLIETIPQNVWEGLSRKIFIIGHPHGGPKVLAYGEMVEVRYRVNSQSSQRESFLTKLGHVQNPFQLRGDLPNLRKILLYTADTCEGSSGSPIISFKLTSGPSGQKLELDLWMHTGIEKSSKLNASIMRGMNEEDLEAMNRPPPSRRSRIDELNEDTSERVTSPVFTVQMAPVYNDSADYERRLQTFYDAFQSVGLPYTLVHTPEDFAQAGFFYAGYADCVRCFECGVGLRSWREGDSINEEHKKHRPNCPFLLAFMRSKDPTYSSTPRSINSSADTSSNANSDDHTPTSSEAGKLEGASAAPEITTASRDRTDTTAMYEVLQQENKNLHRLFTCKVCYNAPVKDLFLPCGELYACTECSKLLTHCPSCKKQILATVTTFFA